MGSSQKLVGPVRGLSAGLERCETVMALDGTAFLALFNDFDPDRDPEYNEWHSGEHVPERLTVSGITRARRYVDRTNSELPYFTLYELASTRTLLSQAYLRLMADPTPWSARMRPSFRRFVRIPCETLASVSEGIGGVMMSVELAGEQLPTPRQWEELCKKVERLDGIVGAHAGLQDASLPGPPGVSATRAPDSTPTVLLLVEAQEPRVLTMHDDAIRNSLAIAAPMLHERARGHYQLMHVLTVGRRPGSRG